MFAIGRRLNGFRNIHFHEKAKKGPNEMNVANDMTGDCSFFFPLLLLFFFCRVLSLDKQYRKQRIHNSI